jgi:hypothetical protein
MPRRSSCPHLSLTPYTHDPPDAIPTFILLFAPQELLQLRRDLVARGDPSTPMALPSEASMFSSSLRTMAWCSLLSAMSWSTWRRELSAAWRSADESSDRPGHGGQPLDQGGAGLGEGHAGHVVRHPGPQGDGGDPDLTEGQLQGGHHAGRHLELALHDADPLNQVGRAGGAVAASFTGRVCGAGAGKAPSPTTMRTRQERASPTTASVKARQWKSGSGPTRYSTSAPAVLPVPHHGAGATSARS